MSTAIVKPEEKQTPADRALAWMMAQVEKRGARLENLLHPDMPLERFTESCRLAFAKAPDLTDLNKTDGASLMQAIMLGARSGLDVHGHYGHLVSFTKTKEDKPKAVIVFMPDYRGLLATAKAAGAILDADAVVVREFDEFVVSGGDQPSVHHVPQIRRKLTEPVGEIVAAYTRMLLPNGRWVVKGLMLLEDIARIEGGIRSKNGPWSSPHRVRMIMKTSFRQAWPWLGIQTADKAMSLRLQALEEAEAIEGEYSVQPATAVPAGIAGAKERVRAHLEAKTASTEAAESAQWEPDAAEKAAILAQEREPGSEG